MLTTKELIAENERLTDEYLTIIKEAENDEIDEPKNSQTKATNV